ARARRRRGSARHRRTAGQGAGPGTGSAGGTAMTLASLHGLQPLRRANLGRGGLVLHAGFEIRLAETGVGSPIPETGAFAAACRRNSLGVMPVPALNARL